MSDPLGAFRNRNTRTGSDPDTPGKFAFRIDPTTGEGEASYTFGPNERDTSFDELLGIMLPEVPCEVLEVIEARAWGKPEEPSKWIRTRVRRREVDWEAARDRLMEDVRKRKAPPRKRRNITDQARTMFVMPADLQIGKAFERGGGSAETRDRALSMIGKVQDRHRDLKMMGRACDDLFVGGMGDTTEGCGGHYPNQPFTIDLNESDQMELATEIHEQWLDAWSQMPGVRTLTTTTVQSNHDRPRTMKGQNHTDAYDSRAFTIWRTLARAYSKNPDRYGHVTFELPEDPMVATVTRHGVNVALIHGHQVSPGGSTVKKVWDWWDGQTSGAHQLVDGRSMTPAGLCSVLVAAHFHHHYLLTQNGKTLVGCPSLDGGSQWLTDSRGLWSKPGLLTFTLDSDGPADIHVIPA